MNTQIIAEHLFNDFFKGSRIVNEDQNPVVNQKEKTKVSDFIQYYVKPGIIIALIKGDTEIGVQQIPIGAVDNFRFMRITDENAIQKYKDIANETEGNQTYEQIQKEYEASKAEVIEEWKKHNSDAYDSLYKKYGDRLLGTDIIQNDKKIIHKDEEGKIAKTEDKGRDEQNLHEIDTIEQDKPELDEGFLNNVVNKVKDTVSSVKDTVSKGLEKFGNTVYDKANNPFINNGIKAMINAIKAAKEDLKKNDKEEDSVDMYVKITNGKTAGDYPIVDLTVLKSSAINGLNLKGNALCLKYDKTGKPTTLNDFRAALNQIEIDGKKIERVSVSLQGLGIYTENESLLKEADDEESTSSTFEEAKSESGEKIALQSNKFQEIKYNGGKLIFSFTQIEEQQKNQDAEDKLFT